jgi:hypothetical protein
MWLGVDSGCGSVSTERSVVEWVDVLCVNRGRLLPHRRLNHGVSLILSEIRREYPSFCEHENQGKKMHNKREEVCCGGHHNTHIPPTEISGPSQRQYWQTPAPGVGL